MLKFGDDVTPARVYFVNCVAHELNHDLDIISVYSDRIFCTQFKRKHQIEPLTLTRNAFQKFFFENMHFALLQELSLSNKTTARPVILCDWLPLKPHSPEPSNHINCNCENSSYNFARLNMFVPFLLFYIQSESIRKQRFHRLNVKSNQKCLWS